VTPGIHCVRARDTGLYDCSSGLGEYFHLEHSFMNKPDTAKIDKEKLFDTIKKFLAITGEDPDHSPHSVELAWNKEEIEDCRAKSSTSNIVHHIDQRKNLVFLLSRMISHVSLTTSMRLKFNGLNLTVLTEKEDFQLDGCGGQPIAVIHFGECIGVNMVPKKHDWLRPNIFDVSLENETMLTIFPETYKHMNIRIRGTGAENKTHVLIIMTDVREKPGDASNTPIQIEADDDKLAATEAGTDQTVPDEMTATLAADDEAATTAADADRNDRVADGIKVTNATEVDGSDDGVADEGTATTDTVVERDDSVATEGIITTAVEADRDDSVADGIKATNAKEVDGSDDGVADEGTATINAEVEKVDRVAGDVIVTATAGTNRNNRVSGVTVSDAVEFDKGNGVTDDLTVIAPAAITYGQEDTIEKSITSPGIEACDTLVTTSVNNAEGRKHWKKKTGVGQSKAIPREGKFISMDLCVPIVNTHGKEVIYQWLVDCGIQAQKKKRVHKLRTLLLNNIQSIHEGKVFPNLRFVSSFLEKLSHPQLLEEAERMKICLSKGSVESQTRRHIIEFLVCKTERSNQTSLPQLLPTDEELSPSEADTELDDGVRGCQTDETSKPNRPENIESKENPKKARGTKEKEKATRKNGTKSLKTDAKKDEKKFLRVRKTTEEGETPRMDDNKPCAKISKSKKQECYRSENSSPSIHEESIRTLENSLLKLQERLATQEVRIESITAHKPQPNHSFNAIKTLEAKTKLVFDNLNMQQNSIDELKDTLTINTKETKKARDKLNQLQGNLCENSKIGQDALSQLKGDIVDWMKSCEVMVTDMKQQFQPMANLISNLSKEVQTLKGEFKMLKQECSKVKHSTCNRQASDTGSAKKVQTKNDPVLVGLTQIREENRIAFEALNYRLNRFPSTENVDKIDRKKDHEPAKTCTHERSSISPDKSEKKTKIAQMTQTETEDRKMSTEDVTTKQTTRDCQQPEAGTEQKQTGSRETYRRDVKYEQPNGNQQRSHHGRDSIAKSRKDGSGLTTASDINKKPSTGSEPRKTDRYRTRKCLIIHDSYLSNFDTSKFSKWYDVTTLSFASLRNLVSSKTLPSAVKSMNPEVIFLHVGQTDLREKTSGNKVILEMKKLIKNMLEHTAAKVCISLIIPIIGMPDVNSVIKQVNSELRTHVSLMRKSQEYADRVFTSNNDDLSGFIMRSVGKHGVELSLNGRGERKLWLHLRDGLNRALKLSPSQKSRNVAASVTNASKESRRNQRKHG
jgi:FtsZ-binding cell division protein ZapB